ncbi:chromate transporter [Paraburkholderia sp. Ac-20336]|uniref:chromate transporter n=1 Tax=Burkholderiaceae TaxID=119060 RepID=UPI0014242965|nr:MULTISPECIES: chromate transporter [Burkholderiaceae]MBN3802652.1 chromate transporter [Paraburkholderia sp. Ac-20336]MBN3846668.1 chromate transporter [Paraburkholderia sp. Ac-20342]NIF51906.1 chromate transporter [Burkholderia sp. Ax-1724]NIF78434.1 chromate transporter [Paraburkholderia sp. Cy-641]
MANVLLRIVLLFAPLSALSFGGGQTIIADVQHQSVSVYHWLSGQEFADLFAISRVSPGPTTLISALIGWHLEGFTGAIVATLAMYIPSSVVFVVVTLFWHKSEGTRWRRAIERGLAPVAVGLIFAGAVAVMESMHATTLAWATTAIAACVVYFTKLNPYILMSAVALIYVAVFYVPL